MEEMLNVLTGGATGLLGSVINRGFAIWERRQQRLDRREEHSHELALLDKQAVIGEREREQELTIEQIRAAAQLQHASYKHAAAIGDTYRWVNAVRALVRPTLVLMLLGLSAWVFVRDPEEVSAPSTILYLTTMAVAWWFGGRAPKRAG